MMVEPGRRAAFFEAVEGRLVPRAHARGPWAPGMLHGRLLAAVLARAIELEHGDPDFHFARTTVDLFRAAPLRPLRLETVEVRSGRRVRVVEATAECDGKVVGKASAVLLRRGDDGPVVVWSPPEWEVPGPEDLPAQTGSAADEPWDFRVVGGADFSSARRRQAWVREVRPLVEGEEFSPYARVVAASDLASPMANAGEGGIGFINADVTLYLRRLPTSEWVGLEVTGHLHQEGVAVGQTTVYDEGGAIGYSSVCAAADARPVGS